MPNKHFNWINFFTPNNMLGFKSFSQNIFVVNTPTLAKRSNKIDIHFEPNNIRTKYNLYFRIPKSLSI